MTGPELLRSLESLEAQAHLLARFARDLRASLEESAPKQARPQPETDEQGNCLHPMSQRIPAPTMGSPDRCVCQRCHTTVQ